MGRRRSGACVCIPYRCGIAAFGQKGYLCGKHHGMMKITSAGFAFSSGRISQIPDDGLPEFAFIGRSNVGKSSLINCLQPERQMETGAISRKIERGRHTTRHSEIIPIKEQTYIMDTPGFSTLDIPGLEKEDLWWYYPEFEEYEPNCRFKGCSHIGEPDCGVKEAVEAGKISRLRYENYRQLYQELKEQKKY